jgi:MarR family 2-MHQ and catechol resistance regulon transcriptional repressor
MRLMRELLQTHEAVTRVGSEQVRRQGLTPVEFDCLTQLGILHPRRMCDLAECSCLTRSRTTQVVTELEKKGLVNRERNAQSDREVMASLTARGQEMFDNIYRDYHQFMQEKFGDRLTRSEQEQVIELLRKLSSSNDCSCE